MAVGGESSAGSDAGAWAGARSHGPWRQAASRFRRRPLGMAALLVVLVFTIVAFIAPRIAPYAGSQLFFQFLNDPQPPSLHGGHLLGTDVIGHDMATQLLWAIRETVLGGLGCALGATVIGVVVGAVAGYVGGILEQLLAWLVSVVVAVPAIVVLAIVVVQKSPLPLWAFPATLSLYLWTYVARAVQSSFATLRVREFVDAAHASGASALRLTFRHLLPNAMGAVLVAGTGVVGQSTVVIATVTFFKYGNQQSDRPTLGGLISNAAAGTPFAPTPWWVWVLPTVTLGLFLVCVNFAADSLDEVLEPAGSA
ncbi:MAG TPA: ABC transporter permease [Gaiellaceae bacterium]|nr:ABC transporter permease [Gaiellaceae bacterium]